MKLIILVIFTLLFSTSSVLAADDILGYSKIDPTSPFYFLKTVRENFEMKLALTPRVKLLRQLEFATRRLREAKTLVDKNQDLIPPTLEKYSAYLKNLPDRELADEEAVTRIKQSLDVHLSVLEEMYENTSNLKAKMAIRSAMNRIILREDVGEADKLSICNLFQKEATLSASLSQTEKAVLSERAKVCQKTNK